MLEWEQIGLQLITLSKTGMYHVFMWMVLLDILTGTLKAVKLKKSNSTIGINGILRHLLVMVVMTIVGVYLPLLGQDVYMNTIYVYMIVQYFTSFLENWGAVGLPLPTWLNESLIKLNEELDKGNINIKDVKSINIVPKDGKEI